jgi:hypothetical protein
MDVGTNCMLFIEIIYYIRFWTDEVDRFSYFLFIQTKLTRYLQVYACGLNLAFSIFFFSSHNWDAKTCLIRNKMIFWAGIMGFDYQSDSNGKITG